MSAAGPERPSVVVRHDPAAPERVLRQVRAGVEEEGVPVEAGPDPAATDVVALAHDAALRSRLEVGVGVDADGAVAVHHAKLPAGSPAFTEPAAGSELAHGGAAHGRRGGTAAARIVTGLPLPIPAGGVETP